MQRLVERAEVGRVARQVGDRLRGGELGEHGRDEALGVALEQEHRRRAEVAARRLAQAEVVGGLQALRRVVALDQGLRVGKQVERRGERDGVVGDVAEVARERPGGGRPPAAGGADQHDAPAGLRVGDGRGAQHQEVALVGLHRLEGDGQGDLLADDRPAGPGDRTMRRGVLDRGGVVVDHHPHAPALRVVDAAGPRSATRRGPGRRRRLRHGRRRPRGGPGSRERSRRRRGEGWPRESRAGV